MDNLEIKTEDLEVIKQSITKMDHKCAVDFYNHLWVEVKYDHFKKTVSLMIREPGFTEDIRKTLRENVSKGDDPMQICYKELLDFLVKNAHVQCGEILPPYTSIVNGHYQDSSYPGRDRAFRDFV